jgi:hypothetical protein
MVSNSIRVTNYYGGQSFLDQNVYYEIVHQDPSRNVQEDWRFLVDAAGFELGRIAGWGFGNHMMERLDEPAVVQVSIDSEILAVGLSDFVDSEAQENICWL